MKIKIVEKKDNELIIEIEGEGHTLCNAIKSILFEDEALVFAGYRIEHALLSKPVLYLKTNGKKDALVLLKETLEKLETNIEEFKEKFQKELEKFK
ncbi:MAG: DNA-directed RNA polymerase subunit L [Candidatus Jordarchaeum sp.]|uniref:DNA-directed RNA polymerase subunit L n=1 Tax=Candidatus Jordarchaeum sp. TaxID=2823881 RepID=UPI00404B086D